MVEVKLPFVRVLLLIVIDNIMKILVLNTIKTQKIHFVGFNPSTLSGTVFLFYLPIRFRIYLREHDVKKTFNLTCEHTCSIPTPIRNTGYGLLSGYFKSHFMVILMMLLTLERNLIFVHVFFLMLYCKLDSFEEK